MGFQEASLGYKIGGHFDVSALIRFVASRCYFNESCAGCSINEACVEDKDWCTQRSFGPECFTREFGGELCGTISFDYYADIKHKEGGPFAVADLTNMDLYFELVDVPGVQIGGAANLCSTMLSFGAYREDHCEGEPVNVDAIVAVRERLDDWVQSGRLMKHPGDLRIISNCCS